MLQERRHFAIINHVHVKPLNRRDLFIVHFLRQYMHSRHLSLEELLSHFITHNLRNVDERDRVAVLEGGGQVLEDVLLFNLLLVGFDVANQPRNVWIDLDVTFLCVAAF